LIALDFCNPAHSPIRQTGKTLTAQNGWFLMTAYKKNSNKSKIGANRVLLPSSCLSRQSGNAVNNSTARTVFSTGGQSPE
jgi:hypothetical protein